MSPGATFERVYRAIRMELGSGRLQPGDALEPAALAATLSASITPVRDALHRLVGERLVESPRRDGFRTPAVTELGLRHLYRWNEALLLLATRSMSATPNPGLSLASDPAGPVDRAELVFGAIATAGGNPEQSDAVGALSDRLRPIRNAELGVIDDIAAELAAIESEVSQWQPGRLRRLLATYHRRRERLAPEIVASLQPRP